MSLLQEQHFVAVSLLFLGHCCTSSFGLLLLSYLPTPAFLINIDFLQQQQQRRDRYDSIRPILLPASRQTLVPVQLKGAPCPLGFLDPHIIGLTSASDVQDDNDDIVNCAGTCFWHASVVRSRDDHDSRDETTASSTFLAELDMPIDMLESQLVLGLNNHHVGSYYWARSAGAGAAMEAPGIQLLGNKNSRQDGNENNTNYRSLHWASTQGPTACNSNDGKRSEWVNFLRPRDQVQLIPLQAEQSILQWIKKRPSEIAEEADETAVPLDGSSFSLGRIFGVSNYKRPLGSEPAVVCEWKLQQQ